MAGRSSRATLDAIVEREVRSLEISGAYTAPNRFDWRLSRLGAGWSARLLREAVGAGPLATIRAVVDGREEIPACTCSDGRVCRWHRAVLALAIVDSGVAIELVLPRVRPLDAAPTSRT